MWIDTKKKKKITAKPKQQTAGHLAFFCEDEMKWCQWESQQSWEDTVLVTFFVVKEDSAQVSF